MATGDTTANGEILACQSCGAKTMSVVVEKNEIAVRCANCDDLVAYTAELIRVLRDPSQTK
ncbi:MAG TPA: hypothetical protein VEU51_00500 [Candidatus Acidoferrales bacterium]|nr:hypothetical protein [Candidatus Acidoferrales bacterium]